jgi:hypothetical protein
VPPRLASAKSALAKEDLPTSKQGSPLLHRRRWEVGVRHDERGGSLLRRKSTDICMCYPCHRLFSEWLERDVADVAHWILGT